MTTRRGGVWVERTHPVRCVVLLAALAGLILFAGPVAPRADAYIYWANHVPNTYGDDIARADLGGHNVNTKFLPGASAAGNVQSVAVDSGHIYWATTGAGHVDPATGQNVYPASIGRANIDGSSPTPNFITWNTSGGVGQVAVDGQHIYFTDAGASPPGPAAPSPTSAPAIGRANLDGSGVQLNFISLPTDNSASALAVQGPFIYFYEGNKIGRANLDGSGISTDFITSTGGQPTYQMAADGAHLYWNLQAGCEGALGNPAGVGRVSLDGGAINKDFIYGRCGIYSTAVDASHVYWTVGEGDRGIGRANIDGSNVQWTFIHASPLYALAVDALGPTGNTPSVPVKKRSPARCVVPNLKGLTLSRAQRLLAARHCRLGSIKRRTRRTPVAMVISQSPRAGTRLATGRSVTVVASTPAARRRTTKRR